MFEQPIVRLYRSAEHADRARTALRRWGFEPERIRQVSPRAPTATTTTTTITRNDSIAPPAYAAPATTTGRDDDIVAALRAAALPEWSARQYADAVRDGYTILVVHAPFGTGGHAEDLLEEGGPLAPEVEPYRRHLLPSNDPAPVSEALGLPTVARRGRTTSEVLGIPTLVRSGRTTSEALGIPAVTRSRPLVARDSDLSDNPAPLSRLLHLPVLARNGRTTSEALGIPAVTRSRQIVARDSDLRDDPAPFSRLLHLPVLLRDRVAGRASPHSPQAMRREILRGDTSPSSVGHAPAARDELGNVARTAPSRTAGAAEPGRVSQREVTRIG